MALRRKHAPMTPNALIETPASTLAVSPMEPALLPDEDEIAEMVRVTETTWARIVSDVLSPPVVWAGVAFLVAFSAAATTGDAVLWGVIYGVLVCLMPALYIGWMVQRGHITDIHIRVRRQRIKPFAVSMLGTLAAWMALRYAGAASLMPLFALCSFVQIAAMFVITLWWQISMHALAITAAVVVAAILLGAGTGLALFPLIFLVSAARVKLRRHTVTQVVAGGLLGAFSTILMFTLAA